MKLSFICHYNDEKILKKYLLSEVFTKKGDELILLTGCPSQSPAYIKGESLAKNDILVFVHQDVLISKEWRVDLAKKIEEVDRRDPKWGVIGVMGFYMDKDNNFKHAGQGECCKYKYFHQVDRLPLKVEWLDSLAYIKKKGVLSFDEAVPKFHGTVEDLCESARSEGRGVWTINLYTKHYSPQTNRNQNDVLECAHYLVKKWNKLVPVGGVLFWPKDKEYPINNLSEITRDKSGKKIPLVAIRKINLSDGIGCHVLK
jgi:hypothetical protein